ncbi:hypothetical protein Lal_00008096 [Lupinus albus]|nr:hypothetical protein Lal_00008096 [Lupinus albus]
MIVQRSIKTLLNIPLAYQHLTGARMSRAKEDVDAGQTWSFVILVWLPWLEQSETPLSVVDLDVLWVDARKNKQDYPKRKGKFANALIVRRLPYYPCRIRDAKFGASKRTLKPFQKHATKAVVLDLQHKYEDLAERFLVVERLLRSKDVEGHQASTVNASFTHPRHHIPIPEEINNCKLFLDISCTCALGIGMVHNTHDAMLHNAQIPSNHVRVSIYIVIEEDALLPIPLDEDIITLGGALGTFVVWPVHLVDVVPSKGKMIAEHSAASPPTVEPASKKTKVVKSKHKENKPRSKSSSK